MTLETDGHRRKISLRGEAQKTGPPLATPAPGHCPQRPGRGPPAQGPWWRAVAGGRRRCVRHTMPEKGECLRAHVRAESKNTHTCRQTDRQTYRSRADRRLPEAADAGSRRTWSGCTDLSKRALSFGRGVLYFRSIDFLPSYEQVLFFRAALGVGIRRPMP